MEISGIKVDNNFLKILSKKFEGKIQKLEKEIFKISNKEFNIGSTKQLGEIMYNELKIANASNAKRLGRPLIDTKTLAERLTFFPDITTALARKKIHRR